MALNQQDIDVGSAPNDGQGDPIRTAFTKCNDNFTQLYSLPNPTPPSTLVGAVGDMPGMYAYDDTYFYYCYAPYDGVSTVWGQLVQSDEAIPSIGNGLSNVVIAFANANITVGVNGTSNIAVFSPIGLAVRGNLNANTSNIGVMSANTLTANVSIFSPSISTGNITVTTDSITSSGSTITIQPVDNVIVNSELLVQGNANVSGNIYLDGYRVILSASATNSTAANRSGIQVGDADYAAFVYNSNINSWVSTIDVTSHGNVHGSYGIFANGVNSNTVTANSFIGNSIDISRISGNGQGLYNLNGANVVGTVASADFAGSANTATYAGIVTVASQPNITAVGVLYSLSVNGPLNASNITSANIIGTNITSANFISLNSVNSPVIGNTANTLLTGTLSVLSNAQPNITQIGSLANLVVGNITGNGTWQTTGDIYAGNIYGNTGGSALTAKQVTDFYQTSIGQVSSLIVNTVLTANVVQATSIGLGGPNTSLRGTLSGSSNAQPNVTSVGNLVSLNVDGGAKFGTIASNTVTISGNTISSGVAGTTLNIGYNVVIPGNLEVQGTTTTVNSNTVSINDLFINVANNASTASQADGGGFGVGPVGAEYASIYYEYTSDNWISTNSITPSGNATLDLGNSTNQWKSLWVSNSTIYINSVPLTMTPANVLQVNGVPVALSSNTGNTIAGNVTASGSVSGGSGNFSGAVTAGSVTASTITANTAILSGGANTAVNIGNATSWFGTVYATSAQALYADLAENYLADEAYAPGTVISHGGSAEVTISLTDADPLVIGVVSTNPAYLMNSSLAGKTVVPIAFTGRIPCRVQGPITRGAMLVSNGDGRARAEANPSIGTVIGKALESFDGDFGVIEIVVGKL